MTEYGEYWHLNLYSPKLFFCSYRYYLLFLFFIISVVIVIVIILSYCLNEARWWRNRHFIYVLKTFQHVTDSWLLMISFSTCTGKITPRGRSGSCYWKSILRSVFMHLVSLHGPETRDFCGHQVQHYSLKPSVILCKDCIPKQLYCDNSDVMVSPEQPL